MSDPFICTKHIACTNCGFLFECPVSIGGALHIFEVIDKKKPFQINHPEGRQV